MHANADFIPPEDGLTDEALIADILEGPSGVWEGDRHVPLSEVSGSVRAHVLWMSARSFSATAQSNCEQAQTLIAEAAVFLRVADRLEREARPRRS